MGGNRDFKFGTNHISGNKKSLRPNDIAGIVQFCTQVDSTLYQIPASGWQTTPKRAWSGSHDSFSISTPSIISLERLKRESPNFVCRRNIHESSASLRITDYPLIGVVRVTWPVFYFALNHIVGIGKASHFTFSVLIDAQEYCYMHNICNGRLIGNRMWPIEWNHCQCPWMTLKVYLCCLKP